MKQTETLESQAGAMETLLEGQRAQAKKLDLAVKKKRIAGAPESEISPLAEQAANAAQAVRRTEQALAELRAQCEAAVRMESPTKIIDISPGGGAPALAVAGVSN